MVEQRHDPRADPREPMEMEVPQAQARRALISFIRSFRLPEPKVVSSTSFPQYGPRLSCALLTVLAPTGLGRSGFCLQLSLGLADLLQPAFPMLQLLR